MNRSDAPANCWLLCLIYVCYLLKHIACNALDGKIPLLALTGIITEVCYLLEVSWQMCHAWITHWTVTRAPLTISRRRSTRDECMHVPNVCEPFLARTRALLAPRAPVLNCDARNKCGNQRPEHGEHPTYQIKHF